MARKNKMVYPNVEQKLAVSAHETEGYMTNPEAEYGQFKPLQEQQAVRDLHEAQSVEEYAGRLTTGEQLSV